MDKAREKALVRGLAAMDEGAWEAFCREYARLLLSFVELCLGCSRSQAEDVVQMPVREQNPIQSAEPQAAAQQLPLGALAAVDQKAVLVMLYNLCRETAMNGWR